MPPSLPFPLLLCLLSVVLPAAQSGELAVLLDLKDALGVVDASWTSSNHHCNFSGIRCDANGNVTDIDLAGKGLSGKLPFQSLCRLPSLSSISLGSNRLQGRIPADVRGCSNLRRLDLAFNLLAGPVPDLSALTKLQLLNLSENGFTGPLPAASLSNLTDLVFLGLGDNPFDISPFPTQVLGLTKLQWLYLSNCSIRDRIPSGIGNLVGLVNLELSVNQIIGSIPPEIGKLKNLWQLELYQNNISGPLPVGFGNLTNLANFDASENFLEGDLSELRHLTKLQSLQLYMNNLSGKIPPEFGDFRDLVNLSLYTNNLTGELPPGLGSWSDFDLLDVSTNALTGPIPPNMCKQGKMRLFLVLENGFTGGIPPEYGNCTSLKRFRVSDNRLSGEVPPGIWGLPNVNIIDLARNNFSGRIGPGIGNAKALSQLIVGENRFSGGLPLEISGAINLVMIDGEANLLSGEIPPTIGSLKRLNNLHLQSNGLSGSIPPSLGSCSALNDLNLADNALSGPIPQALGGVPVLNSLNLSGNLLSGDIPASLASLKLSSLDLSRNHLVGPVPTPLAIDAYSQSFVGNPALCSSGVKVNFLRPCAATSGGRFSDRVRAILSSILAAAGLLVAALGCYLFVKRRRSVSSVSLGKSSSLFSRDSWSLKSFRVLTFNEQEIVTGIAQENLIGKGGSGNVYRVDLRKGGTVAVKHIWNDPHSAGGAGGRGGSAMRSRKGSTVSREFEAEVGTLSSIQHVNVVKLYCSITSEDSSLLVYEYLPNGSLWDMLHGGYGGEGDQNQKGSGGGRKVLEWDARYEVAVGAAKGLEYLHQGCERPILHRDVKSSNILLDEEFKARIADFGLAKILHGAAAAGWEESTRVVAGTYGYIAPEYAYTYKVNEKSDVYSFGVVLMELVTGKRPIESEFGENKDIVHWVYSKMTNKEEVMSLLDPIIPSELEEEAVEVLKVGVRCTVKLPSLRPSMRTVVQMLEDAGRWRPIIITVDGKDQQNEKGREASESN